MYYFILCFARHHCLLNNTLYFWTTKRMVVIVPEHSSHRSKLLSFWQFVTKILSFQTNLEIQIVWPEIVL